jgi:hypothetical protein
MTGIGFSGADASVNLVDIKVRMVFPRNKRLERTEGQKSDWVGLRERQQTLAFLS